MKKNKGFTPLQIFGKFYMNFQLRRKLLVNGRFVTGFTLIELLVVISIIGFLASIILLNMQNVRFQANDAQIQTLMHQLRNAAELSYDQGTETYTAVCGEADNTLSNTGEFATLEAALKKENSNQAISCFESADKKEFAASSPLRLGGHW